MVEKIWLLWVTMSDYGLPSVTDGYRRDGGIRITNVEFETRMPKEPSSSLNVISSDWFACIIDFFETSIEEGYDRECHIGKSTDGDLSAVNSGRYKNPPYA